MSQISCHLEKRIQSLDDEQRTIATFSKCDTAQGSWWTDQVETCKAIDSTWKILDSEFADRRKLLDELLSEKSNLRPVKRDSKSFTHLATTTACYVNDMKDNGCRVLESVCPNFCPNSMQRTIQVLAETWQGHKKRSE